MVHLVRGIFILTELEAEIDTNGVVRLLSPIKVARKGRALVQILDAEIILKNGTESNEGKASIRDLFGSASLGTRSKLAENSTDSPGITTPGGPVTENDGQRSCTGLLMGADSLNVSMQPSGNPAILTVAIVVPLPTFTWISVVPWP